MDHRRQTGEGRFPQTLLSLAAVQDVLRRAGCNRLFVKELAWNHDSKRQIYLTSNLSSFNTFPTRVQRDPPMPVGIVPTRRARAGSGGRIYGHLNFQWIDIEGATSEAPQAKLVYYPQYPEVRLSGFLRGASRVLSVYLRERAGERFSNRLLFLGVRSDGLVIAFLAVGQDALRDELRRLPDYCLDAGLNGIPLGGQSLSPRDQLLRSLRDIHRRGHIPGQRLRSGQIERYSAPNAVGYTLEACLGIEPNGDNRPDYLGWEVKAHTVDRFGGRPRNAITLMTPEPDRGVYVDDGVIRFMERWGYPDRRGRSNRRNFGGIYHFDRPVRRTGLRLCIRGYDAETPDRFDPDGYLALMTSDGVIAAGWSLQNLVNVWCRKHAAAAYVPAVYRGDDREREFWYGGPVLLCEGADFVNVLAAIRRGAMYLDPAVKVEGWGTGSLKVKRRNQFRIKYLDIPLLYQSSQNQTLE